MRKLSRKAIKKKAWDAFSLYIRKKSADADGVSECVTCGVRMNWKLFQAGHFVDGRNNTVLFDERLVHPQCYRCNVPLKGNKIKYVLFMKKKYGYTDEQIEDLDNLKHKQKNITTSQLEDIYELYRCAENWD